MNELLGLILEPKWRCRYRGQGRDYKERYQKGIVLFNHVLSYHKTTPEIIDIGRTLKDLAIDILSYGKTIEEIDCCFILIQERINSLG